jgi:hypothetical protein
MKTASILVLETPTMNDIRIKCKECQMWFMRVDWMANKNCDNPNCRCPEVNKVRQAANQAIQKASESSKINVVNIKRGPVLPTGYNEKTNQYMRDVADVMTIEMIVPKNRRKGV